MTDDQKPTEAQNQGNVEQGQEPAIDKGYTIDDEQPEVDAKQKTDTPDKEETPQPEKETFINQEAVNDRIKKISAERSEERRKRQALENELEQIKAKLSEKKPPDEIVIPELPDAFDPEYEFKIKLRDDALKRQAIAEAKKTVEREAKETAEKQRLETERETVKGYVDTMYSEGEKIGIKGDDLKRADDTVALYIKDPELARYIISHDKAALIVRELSENLDELEQISKMSPLRAATHIVSHVLPKAVKFKPIIPKTPAPLDIPDGRPAGEKRNKYLKGVVME